MMALSGWRNRCRGSVLIGGIVAQMVLVIAGSTIVRLTTGSSIASLIFVAAVAPAGFCLLMQLDNCIQKKCKNCSPNTNESNGEASDLDSGGGQVYAVGGRSWTGPGIPMEEIHGEIGPPSFPRPPTWTGPYSEAPPSYEEAISRDNAISTGGNTNVSFSLEGETDVRVINESVTVMANNTRVPDCDINRTEGRNESSDVHSSSRTITECPTNSEVTASERTVDNQGSSDPETSQTATASEAKSSSLQTSNLETREGVQENSSTNSNTVNRIIMLHRSALGDGASNPSQSSDSVTSSAQV